MRVRLRGSAVDRPNVRGWLRADREYLVLSVEGIGPVGTVYRIQSEDNGMPALFESGFFELVDNTIPASWIAVQQEGVPIQLMPRGWAKDGFWEAFFDGDPSAQQEYEAAVKALLQGQDR